MNPKIIIPIFILVLASMACNAQTAAPTQTTPIGATPTDTSQAPLPTVTLPAISTNTPLPPTPTVTASAVPTLSGVLALDQLKNGTYYTPVYGRNVTLVNGAYSEGSGANAFSVQMLDVYAFGDLNGDGKADAGIVLAESGGGSGEFESLVAVTNQNGSPHQQSQVQLGDRVQIKSMDISNGVIHLSMLVQGPNDPMCCPSLAQQQNFWLIDNKLWLMRVTSTIGGMEHYINVDLPVIWSKVSNPFTVNGTLDFLPFENTLAYRIYTTDGTKVNESTLTVTPSSGTAGTFSHDFNLSSAGVTDWAIIQFVDVSAADGSTIALGSVILKAH